MERGGRDRGIVCTYLDSISSEGEDVKVSGVVL
jgi:hypothetical protein